MAALLWLWAVAGTAGLVWLLARHLRLRRHLDGLAAGQGDFLRLAELARRVTGNDWQSGIQVVLQDLVRLGYGRGAVILALTEDGELQQRAVWGCLDNDWRPADDPEVRAALEHGEMWVDRRRQRLLLPLAAEGEPLGLLAVCGLSARHEAGAAQAQLTFLKGAAGLAGLTLCGLRSLREQAALSVTDGLTGLSNHRHFHHQLSAALAQSYLAQFSLTLILLDIDEFKQVNDTHGHLFGDLVLRQTAGVIRTVAPPSAILGRYGGEEFAVALPESNQSEGIRVAEEIRLAVAHRLALKAPGVGPVRITVSAGVAVYQLGQGKNRLIARADEALYTSKRNGRNRVTVAPPDSEPATVSIVDAREHPGGPAGVQ